MSELSSKHKLLNMIDNLLQRDKQMVEEMTSWMGGGMTLEKRIELADARAKDALAATFVLAKYIIENEQKS